MSGTFSIYTDTYGMPSGLDETFFYAEIVVDMADACSNINPKDHLNKKLII